jgi:ribonuclease HI
MKDSEFLGQATNNEAEYQALILGLKSALSLGVQGVRIYMDSELLVRQIKGLYKVRNPKLAVYFQEARDLLSKFTKYDIVHIPREENGEADRMANEAIRRQKGF